ncbi:MAG TPA: protein kinase [Ktedonobacterales bacterium]|jgi:serine/threonine protein kinase
MARLIGQQLGSYRLTRLLAQGGFAEVYLGEHVYVPRLQVAIKVLSEAYTDSEIQAFCNEANIIFRLVHPLIVRVLDFGVEERTPFLVMDYAPKGNLRQRHPQGTRVPLGIIVEYIQQVAEALRFAHEAKVVHRDIKPENLLVGWDDQILLGDFGIAIKAHRPISQTPQKISGTALYMAPEQCEGKARQESDQYALAVLVYEWLSGEPPFFGQDPISIALQHIQSPPPLLRAKLPTLAPEVEDVVLKALAKDPNDRFPNVQAFALALEKASTCAVQQSASFVPAHQLDIRPDHRRLQPTLPESSPAREPTASPPRAMPLQSIPPPPIPGHSESLLKDAFSPDSLASPFQPPTQPEIDPTHARQRSRLKNGSILYSLMGWLMVLMGIITILKYGGNSALLTWIIGGIMMVFGGVIGIGMLLLP